MKARPLGNAIKNSLLHFKNLIHTITNCLSIFRPSYLLKATFILLDAHSVAVVFNA